MSFDFTAGPFRGPGNQQPYFHELMMRIASLPGARMVGAVSEGPLSRRRMPDQPVTLEGRPVRSASESPQVITRAVTPAYFPIMGIPLKKGRLFTEGDAGDGKLVAIVNETAARRYWPGADPIGKRLAMGSVERFGYFRVAPELGRPEWREIVGIIATSAVRHSICRLSRRSFTTIASIPGMVRPCWCALVEIRCHSRRQSGGKQRR
jgi:hypothetical protein